MGNQLPTNCKCGDQYQLDNITVSRRSMGSLYNQPELNHMSKCEVGDKYTDQVCSTNFQTIQGRKPATLKSKKGLDSEYSEQISKNSAVDGSKKLSLLNASLKI